MAQGTDISSRDLQHATMEKLDLWSGTAYDFFDHLHRVGALNLISIGFSHDRTLPGCSALVSFKLYVIPAGFSVILNPIMSRGPAD